MNTRTLIQQVAATRPEIEPLTENEIDAMFHRVLASSGELRVLPPQRSHGRRWVALSGVAAALIAAVALGIQLWRPAPHVASVSGAALRARLLSALVLNTDIIEMRETQPDGSSLVDWSNAQGTINHVIQSGWPETLTVVSASGTTLVAKYPATMTWMTTANTGSEPIGNSNAITQLRSKVQAGRLRVLAENVEVDGHRTIEVLLTDPPLPASADEYLWVDATSDLPIQERPTSSSNPAGTRSWSYFPANGPAQSKLTMPIPAGYTEVSPPPGSIVPAGGEIQIKIFNGSGIVDSTATCPRGGPSCFVVPRTLPLPTSQGGPSGTSGPTGATP